MKLTFLSIEDLLRFDLIMATSAYERIWKQDGEKIRHVFKKHTGLKFQQKEIKVTVHDDVSMSGTLTKPMRLNTRNYTLSTKRFALVHELGHRLLSGNQLGSREEDEQKYIDEEHRRLYLFEGDVIKELYGPEIFHEWSQCNHDDANEPFDWAYALSAQERKQKLKHLIATDKLLI